MDPRHRLMRPLLTAAILALPVAPAGAAVETRLLKTFSVDGTPLVVENSADGQSIYVLTDKSEVLVYGVDGLIKERIHLEEPADEMIISPAGNALLLTNRSKKSVRVLAIDFIKSIDIAGAPSKGPADAPVTIALFSDFQ